LDKFTVDRVISIEHHIKNNGIAHKLHANEC